MSKYLKRTEINEILNFLEAKLPPSPTAVKELYSLPKNLAKEARKSDYSTQSIQKISNHIGYYLGLLTEVKITIVEDDIIRLDDDGKVRLHSTGSANPGLYKTFGPGHSEIEIKKKKGFGLSTILAILAHECVHNYLYHYNIKYGSDQENEIQTEIATIYLGLGVLFVNGYNPVTTSTTHTLSGHIKHQTTVGYIYVATVRKALLVCMERRNWRLRDVLKRIDVPGHAVFFWDYVWDQILPSKYFVKRQIFPCVSCGRRVRIRLKEAQGKIVKCPACKTIVKISSRRKYNYFQATWKFYLVIMIIVILIAISGQDGNTYQSDSIRQPSGILENRNQPISYNSLSNGTVLGSYQYYLNGLGELKIDNGTGYDTVAKLVRVSADRSVYTVYIKAKNIYKITGISDGVYKLYFSHGKNWNSVNKEFLVDKSYSIFDESFSFTTTEKREGNQLYDEYSTYEVTLHPVISGDAKTSGVSESEFDKY